MDRRYHKRMENYWLREERKSIMHFSRLDLTSWFDYWHTHPDWKAKGNKSLGDRVAVASQTYKLLNHAETLLKSRGPSVQCWATFCESTTDNAIYIHSQNPNGSPFPYQFDGIQWGVEPPQEAASLIDLQKHEIGKFDYTDCIVYAIRARA